MVFVTKTSTFILKLANILNVFLISLSVTGVYQNERYFYGKDGHLGSEMGIKIGEIVDFNSI